MATLPQTNQLAPCVSVSNFHLPPPFTPNHLSPFVALPHFSPTLPPPTSTSPSSSNPTFPPASSASSPLTPQFSNYSPLPIFNIPETTPLIGSSPDFCPLSFSALFSSSDTQQSNPFQSLTLAPFPIDPTHTTIFTSPFALSDTPSPDANPSPPYTPSPNTLASCSASLFGFALPSLSLSACSAGAPLLYHRPPLPPPHHSRQNGLTPSRHHRQSPPPTPPS